MGFPKIEATPIAGWFISWKQTIKMDDDWGYPYDETETSK